MHLSLSAKYFRLRPKFTGSYNQSVLKLISQFILSRDKQKQKCYLKAHREGIIVGPTSCRPFTTNQWTISMTVS